MNKAWAKFRSWNPSTALAAGLITVSSIIIVVSLVTIFMVNQDQPGESYADSDSSEPAPNSTTEVQSPIIALVSHISPTSARLYVEQNPGEPVENASYTCLQDGNSLAATGGVEFPFTLITGLESGTEVSCSVQHGIGNNRVEAPAFYVPFALSALDRERVAVGANMVNTPQPTVRVSWPIDAFPEVEDIWVEYVVMGNGNVIGAGSQHFSAGSILHELSDELEAEQAELYVWLSGKYSGNKIAAESYIFNKTEDGSWSSTPVLLTANDFVAYELSQGFASSVLNEGEYLALESISSKKAVFGFSGINWMVLSETGSLRGAWKTVALSNGMKEIENTFSNDLPFFFPAKFEGLTIRYGIAQRLNSSEESWRIVNPKLMFTSEDNIELSWDMWSPANGNLTWERGNAANFIVNVKEVATGWETVGISAGETTVSLQGLKPNSLYKFSIDYFDMVWPGNTVIPEEFVAYTGVDSTVITQVPFTAHYANSGLLTVEWQTVEASYPVEYWVQVLDPDRKILIQESIVENGGVLLNREFALEAASPDYVFVRLTAVTASGNATSTPFTLLEKSNQPFISLEEVENLRADRIGGREIDISWNTHPVLDEEGFFELQEYESSAGWRVLEANTTSTTYLLALEEGQESFTLRVRARTEGSVGPFSVIRCSINNGLFCD